MVSRAFSPTLYDHRPDINFLCQLFAGFWKNLSSYALSFMSSLGAKFFTVYICWVSLKQKIITFCGAPEWMPRENLETQEEGLESRVIMRK